MCFFCKKFLFLIFVLYTIFGFFFLPLLLKPQIVKSVNENLNAHITIDSISFNPFIFKFSINNVILDDMDKKPLLSFDTFFINIDPSSLLYGAVRIKEIALSTPHIYLNNSQSKGINFLHILKPSSDSTSKEESSLTTLPRIIIDKVSLKNGRVDIVDSTREKPFTFSVKSIGIVLKNIDTKELDRQDATFRFYSHLSDGGFINLKSKIVALEPFIAGGSLDFEASQLYTEYRYIQENLNLEVADGKVSFHSLYNFNSKDLNSTVLKNLIVHVSNLRIKPKHKKRDILTLKEFSVSGVAVYPFLKEGSIEKVSLNHLDIKMKRNKNGVIDWRKFIIFKESADTNKTELKTQNSSVSKKSWQLRLKKLALEKISLEFQDSAVTPHVNSEIKKFDFYAKDITLDGKTPISYNLMLDANDKFHCQGEGTLIHKKLNLSFDGACRDLDIVHYKPYIDQVAKESLSVYDLELQKAMAGVTFHLKVEEKEDNKTDISLRDSSFYVDDVKLAKESTSEKLVAFQHMGVENFSFDSMQEKINVGLFKVKDLKLNAKRYKNGTLNLENLLVPHKEKREKVVQKKETAYAFLLKNFIVDNANLSFEDNSLSKPVENNIRKINFQAKNISLKKGAWFDYTINTIVNKKGEIRSRGAVCLFPLKQKGIFSIYNLALTPLTPYLQESTYIAIEDGRVSLRGKTTYSISKKRPDLRVESSFLLESLFVNNSKDKNALLSVNDVKTKQFTLELSPNRFYINELDINSFYVNALIDKNKTMNFQKLLKKSKAQVQSKKVEKEKIQKEEEPFPVKILKVNVKLGSAKFADYSIPIHFSTHIHNLNGVLYSLSNVKNETSYVDIVGDVDAYGSTSLRGSFDGSDPLAYTDLAFNFKNLAMRSLSGYSASFAGYEIADGKLYLDLGYKIVNSELLASNSIIMKKVVLGKEIEDENVTVLPLGFLFGLLEDSDGVIDINIPIEGNVSNPDFKYGTLILSTIGGLVKKAVTSPFKFLGSMMGFDAEAIKFVLFEPARTVISPPEREKLDQIYKIMLKKPKISLLITGSYDKVLDTHALKIIALIDRVMIKSGIKNRKDHESAMSTPLLEDIYKDMRDDDYLEKLKQRVKKEGSKDFEHRYHNELLAYCIEIQVLKKHALLDLAEKRADKMVTYLVEEKGISPSRVIKLAPKSSENEGEKMIKVEMSIEVK